MTALLLESWFDAMSGDLRPARRPLVNLTRWYAGFVLSQAVDCWRRFADLAMGDTTAGRVRGGDPAHHTAG